MLQNVPIGDCTLALSITLVRRDLRFNRVTKICHIYQKKIVFFILFIF